MKSFVLVSGDFTTHGGMDCANFHLANWLAAQSESAVHLVAYHVAEPLAAHPNVTWHRIKKLFNSYTLSDGRLSRAGCALAQSIPGCRVIVNGGNCDWADVNWVHYVHAAWNAGVAGTLALRIRRAFQQRRNLASERRAVGKARLVIANSNRTRRDLIEHVGIEPQRVRTVYYGIDATRFRPAAPGEREATRSQVGIDSNAPLVAFVGALGDRRKGFDLLFDAWRMLAARGQWDAILLVIGRGAELPHWESRARELGLDKRIRFLGFRQDVPDLMRACDALVSPTRYEAYGLGVHEAICCGIPALVSASAGVAERYPQELAPLLLPEPLDAEAVAARLYDWRQRMADYAAITAPFAGKLRAISWDEMSRQITEAIEVAQPTERQLSAASAR